MRTWSIGHLTFVVLRRVRRPTAIAARAAFRRQLPRDCAPAIREYAAQLTAHDVKSGRLSLHDEVELTVMFARHAGRIAAAIKAPERSRSQLNITYLAPDEHPYIDSVDPTIAALDRLTRLEILGWLFTGEDLSATDHEALLCAAAGLSAEQMAERLAIAPNTADQRLSRARRRARAACRSRYGASIEELLDPEPLAA